MQAIAILVVYNKYIQCFIALLKNSNKHCSENETEALVKKLAVLLSVRLSASSQYHFKTLHMSKSSIRKATGPFVLYS